MRKLLAFVLLFALVLAGCGGDNSGGDEGDGGSSNGNAAAEKTKAPATKEISEDDLALMVLPQPELGDDYAGFDADSDGGYQSNDDTIDADYDPDDEAEDVEKYGRVNGYEQMYMSLAAVEDGEGVLMVGTGVTLFEDEDGSSEGFDHTAGEWVEREGGESEGMTLVSVTKFSASGIGEKSQGFVLEMQSEDFDDPMYATMLAFQRGRIHGLVVLMALDDGDYKAGAKALAKKLDQRIQDVLDGEIKAEPTAKPKTPTAKTTPSSKATPTRDDASGNGTPESGDGKTTSPSEVLSSFKFRMEMDMGLGAQGIKMQSEGAWVAPDSAQCQVQAEFGNIVAADTIIIVIGDEAWVQDQGDEWLPVDLSDADVESNLSLCPIGPDFWSDFPDFEDSGVPSKSVTKNGVKSQEYSLAGLAEGLQGLGVLPEDMEGVEITRFDVWVAEEGGWIVALEMEFSADADSLGDAFGAQAGLGQNAKVTIKMSVNITDANSKSIKIEPPI